MPALKYAFCALPLVCKCCSVHHGEQHDEDCIINIPGEHSRLAGHWYQGYNDMKKDGCTAPKPTPVKLPADKAHMMGARLANKHRRAERTTKSLEQAVEQAKERTRAVAPGL